MEKAQLIEKSQLINIAFWFHVIPVGVGPRQSNVIIIDRDPFDPTIYTTKYGSGGGRRCEIGADLAQLENNGIVFQKVEYDNGYASKGTPDWLAGYRRVIEPKIDDFLNSNRGAYVGD